MSAKPRKRLGSGLRGLEELESRKLLAGHGFAAPFAETGGGFFAAAQVTQNFSVASLSAAFRSDIASTSGSSAASFDGRFHHSDDGDGDSSSSELTATLTDTSGDTITVTYQTGNLLGTTESVISVSGDTADEGTSVALSIGGVSVGNVAINSSGSGTLIVPTSSLSTTVAAGSTITYGSLTGTLAAASDSGSGDSGDGGCGSSSSSGTSLTASLTGTSGNTVSVTYQTGKLLGTTDSVITVSGDTADEGTSVALTIGGVSLGTIAINSSGSGTLIVPTSTLSSSVAAGSAITLGSLSGTFAAASGSTSGGSGDSGDHGCGSSSSGTSLSSALTDPSGDTATATYQTGKLLGTAESVIAVTGDTVDEGTSVAVAINGVSVGSIAIDSSGSGALIVPTSTLSSTTVASGSTITIGNFSGTFATATSSTSSASSTFSFVGHHRGRH